MLARSVLAAALAAFVFSTPAFANELLPKGSYIKGDLGISLVHEIDRTIVDPETMARLETTTRFKTGIMGAIGMGMRVHENFRLEGEISHMAADHDQLKASWQGRGGSGKMVGDISSTSLTLGGYFDLSNGPLRPYLGLGLGLAYWKEDVSSINNRQFKMNEDGINLTAFSEIGAAYYFLENLAVTAGYRYQWVDADHQLTYHAIKAGIRYEF